MRALRFEGRLKLADVPEPVLGPDEALLEVLRAGICATDRAIVAGYAGFAGTLGHEMVGTVRSCPAARHWEGKRAVAEINVTCGSCARCRAGERTHCERRSVLGIRGRDGAFAERIAVPIANLHAVPQDVSDTQAVFAEPLAAALRIAEQVAIARGCRVTVVGDGKLGLLVAAVLVELGAAVHVVGRHEHKLRIAHGFGARIEGSPANADQDVVVEATGSAEGLTEALARVRPRGTVVLKSTLPGLTQVGLERVVVDEIDIVGSRCGPMDSAVEWLRKLDLQPLIAATYPLSEGVLAFEHARRRGVLKVLLDPQR